MGCYGPPTKQRQRSQNLNCMLLPLLIPWGKVPAGDGADTLDRVGEQAPVARLS